MFYINLLNSPNQIMVLLGILCFGILADQAEQLMGQSSEDAQGSYYDVAGHVDRKYAACPGAGQLSAEQTVKFFSCGISRLLHPR